MASSNSSLGRSLDLSPDVSQPRMLTRKQQFDSCATTTDIPINATIHSSQCDPTRKTPFPIIIILSRLCDFSSSTLGMLILFITSLSHGLLTVLLYLCSLQPLILWGVPYTVVFLHVFVSINLLRQLSLRVFQKIVISDLQGSQVQYTIVGAAYFLKQTAFQHVWKSLWPRGTPEGFVAFIFIESCIVTIGLFFIECTLLQHGHFRLELCVMWSRSG